jgi:hypothetical protein
MMGEPKVDLPNTSLVIIISEESLFEPFFRIMFIKYSMCISLLLL